VARSRFLKDTGLTVRMSTVMFALGALFVGLVVGLMYAVPSQFAWIIAVIGLAVAWGQWYFSDTVAMRGMRAHEVSPEEDPELHGIVDRLCALADMPKPRVAVADIALPNAFATGRTPDRSVVCVTTGIRRMLTPEELEAVLAHELSHVAHRDVLVMTIASSAGIIAGFLMRSARFGGLIRRGKGGGLVGFAAVLLISLAVYAISFLLLRLLSRYRELCADRSGAYLTQKPAALASALQKISGGIAATPQRDLRASQAMNAFFIAPAVTGLSLSALTATHPSLEQRLDQLARIATELGRPLDGGPVGGAPAVGS
jgi:heat shock protein HtpX